MNRKTRRKFLADVGKGMLIGSIGSALAFDLGLAPVFADDDGGRLSFGTLEPLVGLMQETPPDKLQPLLVEKLKSGADLRTLVAAGALANARTFGGQDYVGFHTIMALAPAYEMARELPEPLRPLPVLKVLYRNTHRIQEFGGWKNEVLHTVDPGSLEKGTGGGELLRAATRSANYDQAEQTFAALAKQPVGEAFNHLQYAVQDEVNVHRVVLAWRAWALLDFTGQQHAHTLFRQSVRFCVNHEQNRRRSKRPEPAIRSVLPKMLDQHRLLSRKLGKRKADDAWVDELSRTIFAGTREQAADAAAAALAEGFDPEVVGEAISVAANLLLLHDPGRDKRRVSMKNGKKPVGSCHGDSVGVHASDAANAWRNIARVSNHRNTVASLIVGAYHTAGQAGRATKQPYPHPEHLEQVRGKVPKKLLESADSAIREKDQFRACAIIQRYGELGHAARPVFDLLLRYATSEFGALHAEKYYRTVSEEFVKTRAAFRWRQLVALARVTASEYGNPAPGYQDARELLGLT
ncbi:MAG: hypothetical protein IH991_02020 [Planctomycetes bacterium]|nr:hypothetical protein [Planctomycetota bacterium]